MRYWLNPRRTGLDLNLTIHQKYMRIAFCLVVGAAFGLLAKLLDNQPIIGEIGTNLGVWIMTATLLAAWSRSPRAAALHVFSFFMAMLAAYYAYSMILFGFFPRSYFLAWASIALLTPIWAWIVWYARETGWMAAFSASLPISGLLGEGYSFFYTLSIPRGFDVLAAGLLFVILPQGAKQRLRVVPITAAVVFVIWRLNLLSRLFGGL